MRLSFDLLALYLGDIAILAVGAWAWKRNYRSGAARSFFITTLVFAFWLTTNYFSLQPESLPLIDFFTRIAYAGGLWLTIVTWIFCYRFPSERKLDMRTQLLLIILLVAGSVFTVSKLAVTGVSGSALKFVIIPGPLYWVYVILVGATMFWAMLNLRNNYAAANLLQRNQIRYVAFGIGMASVLTILFDVILVLFNPQWGNPLINLLITLLTVMFLGYGLIRHRYMDVHRLASWLFTYGVCFGLAAGLIGAADLILVKLYPFSAETQRAGIAIVALLAVFAVQPVKRRVKLGADRLFNVGWYDSQTLLNAAGVILAGELRLASLLENSLHYICTELRVTAGELVILNEGKASQTVGFGDWQTQAAAVDLATLPETNAIVVVDELSTSNPLHKAFEPHAVRISVPLQTRQRHIGYLLLGVKQHGDIFSEQDIAVLQILSSQLAVAIISARAFEQISQFNNKLQEKVNDATRDLTKAHEKLKLDDRMKTEFIVLTSHNLRTPLSIIKNYLNLLEESRLTNDQHKFVDSMKTGTDRLSQFTEDLLTIDSIVAGDELVLQTVTAEDVLLPLVKEAKELAKAGQLKFKTNLAVDGLTLNINPLRLSSAIRHLLDNAFKFTEHGEVTLSAKRNGKNLIIAVTDTGVGIAARELPTLFSKFHQATDVMNYKHEGEGIGLYLTNLVVKEHGGQITATSKLNKGSRFEISLPVAVEATAKNT